MSHSHRTSNKHTRTQRRRARALGLSAGEQETKALSVSRAVLVSLLSAGLWTVGSAAHADQAPQSSAAPASNQRAAESSDEELSEIIVTARRVEERAQDVPISMTIFNQQQLTDRNIVTSGDLAAFTPSMSVDNEFGQDVTSFAIRGFVQALNTTPSVAVYFADAVVPRGGNVGEPAGSGATPGSFFDLQNVQVLKGPQGTLFGRNTDGGAVLLVPKKPTSDFEGYIEGSYGNFDLGHVEGVINIPINDSLRVRLGITHEERKGYMDNVSGIGPSNFNDIDFTAARASVVLDITPDIENYTIGTYTLSVNNGVLPQQFDCNPTQVPTAIFGVCPAALARTQAGGPYATNNDLPGAESYLRQFQVINTTSWHISDNLTVKNIFNYGQLLTSLDSALFGLNYVANPTTPIFTTGSPIIATTSSPTPGGLKTTDQYTGSDELQLQGNLWSSKLVWQAGGYIERSGPISDLTGSQSPGFVSCTEIATFQCYGPGIIGRSLAATSFSDLAAYAQATYKIIDQLKLTGGLRYTNDQMESTFSQVNYGFTAPDAAVITGCNSKLTTVALGCVQHYTENSNAPTYLVDLDYNPIQDVLLYGKYSRGYRQGGVATFVADGYHTYAAEHVNAFEIGEKTTFTGLVSGTFNVAGFYNDFSNQQLLAGFTGGLGVNPSSGIVNAGKSHIWGVEVESSITPVKPFTLGVDYTYLNTKLVSATSPTLSPTSGFTTVIFPFVAGDPLPYSPKNKFSANASYHLPLPDTVGNVSVEAIFTYTSTAYVSLATPDSELNPYGLLNMNVTWNSIEGKPFDLELFGSNITNRLYYNNVTEISNTPLGAESRFPGEPRMYGARFRIRFGK